MDKQSNDLFNVSFDSIQDDTLIDVDDTTGEDVVKIPETVGKTNDPNPTDKVKKTEDDNQIETEEETSETNQSTSKTSNKEDTPNPEEDSSPITPFASLLQEKGFLPNLDLEEFKKAEDPIEALAEAFKKEDEFRMEAIINRFPEELIDLAKAVAEGVPFDQVKESKIKELNFNAITEDQLKEETNQIKVIEELYKIRGFKTDKIKKYIDTFKDLGSLEEEAKDALPEIKDFYKVQQDNVKKQFQAQQAELEKRHKETIGKIQSTVQSVEEIIPGIKLNDVSKANLFKNMTQIVGQDQNGNPVSHVMQMRSKDPVKFDMAVTYLADLTKGFTDWSKISKTAKTSAVKEFEKAVNSTSYTYGKPNKGTNLGNQDTQDIVKGLQKMFGK